MIATAPATPAPVVQYRPVGAVRDAVAARDPEVLVAGPAGTGKTLGVCWKLHLAASRYPKARILMVRKTLESLKTGALHTFQNGVQPERWGVATFGGNKFSPAEFRYPNGSVIIVSGMDKAEKVLSAEYDLIFCFTGDTRVESPSPIEKGYKREYSGPLVTIRTAAGNELTGTPNHPILTDQGWVPLGGLCEGDKVISRSRVEDERSGGNPDVHHQPPTIAEVTRSLALAPSSRTERVEAVGMDFHGDGAEGDVDVVTAAGGLHLGRDTALDQPIVEHEGIRRDFETHSFVGDGAFSHVVFGVDEATVGFMGELASTVADVSPLRSLAPSRSGAVGRRLEVARPVGVGVAEMPVGSRFAHGSGLEATSPEFGFEGAVADTDGSGNLGESAFPFEVTTDRVVHVLRTHTDERAVRHVYNLQTADHYYVANNIIAHNCNEATELSETDWETLTSRLRNGRMPYQQIIADCNPSGPRHWLNVRCHRGQTRRITSTHRDNPAYWDTAAGDWTPLGRQYVETTLAGLTGVQRKRLYEGVWAAAEGLVYPEFDPDTHVAETDTAGWRTVLGVDVGSRNPTAILTIHLAADERMHISHEVYRRNMTATAILDAICERVDATGAEAVYIDPSAKGYIDDLHARGYPATAAVNDVLVGIQRVHAAFSAGVTIDPGCVNTIDELGMYAYPENPKIETDKPTKDHDHALDAWRYVCATESPLLEGELFW